MATTRIKDISKTTTDLASDTYGVFDGSTNGTQKMSRDDMYADWAAAYVAAPTTYKLAPLNSGTNKIDATYLPTSGDTPKGEWNANTNSPALADGSGTAGDYYDVTTAGTQDLGSGSIAYTVGDVVKYNGSTWYKIDSVANILDGSATAADGRSTLSVNSKDEDAQANALKTTAPALYFNGTSSVVTVADDDKFSFTDGVDDLPFSMSAWAYVPDPAATLYLAGKWGSSAATQEWLFATNTSGQIRLTIGDGTSSFTAASADSIPSAGWYHFAASYSGSGPNSANSFDNAVDGVKLFINGVESSISGTTTGYTGQTNTIQTVRLGAASNLFSKGSIRDCKLFNRELTATEVAELARGNDLGFSEEWGGANGGLDTSNFSAGVDGFTGNYGTLTAGTASEDGIGGEDDWLKLTLNTSSAIHQILSPQVMPVGARVRVEFDCYIPSTNSHVDGVKANLSSTITSEVIATNEGATTDTVFRVSGEGIATGNQRVYITALDGSSTTVSDAGGDDWIAIKNVKITQLGNLASFSAERYDTSTSKLYDISDNAFVGTGTSVSLTGLEQPVYETGTWTPTITFGGGSAGMTYGTREGYYTRVGRTVTVSAYVGLTLKGSSTGSAQIASLPFSAANLTTSMDSLAVGAAGNMAALTSNISGIVTENNTTVDLYDWGATGTAVITEANFTDTSFIRFSATYQIQ